MREIDSLSDRVILTALGVLTFLFLYLTAAQQVSGMSIGFATSAADGDFWFHPHHLLYQPSVAFLHMILGPLGVTPIGAGQFQSLIWGVVTVVSTYVIAAHAIRSKGGAVLTALSLLAVHGFVVYSTQIEPYIPILGMTSLLGAILVTKRRQDLGWKLEILFIALMSLSLLFHQAMLFFFIPMAYFLIGHNGRAGFMSLLRIVGATGIIVLGTYIGVYWVENPQGSWTGFYRWMMYYQVISDATHGTVQDLLQRRLRVTVRSVTQLFVALARIQPTEWIYLGRYTVSVVVPILVAWTFYKVIKNEDGDKIRRFLLIWAGTFALFFFWWQAAVYKFFIPTLVPFAVLAAYSIKDLLEHLKNSVVARNTTIAVTIAAILFVGTFNLVTSVLPLSRSPGAVHALAEKLVKAGPEGCSIYSMRYLGGYVSYYFKKDTRPFNLMFRKYYYSTRDPAVADTISTDSGLDNEDCAVIPLYWVSSEYFADRSEQAIGRYLDPDDWSLFVAYLLEIRTSDASNGITFAPFESVEDSDGDRYLVIDRTNRATATSIDSVLESLDELYFSRPPGSFSLENQPEVGLRRHLAFGYN